MPTYELVVILPPDSGPDERKAQDKTLEDLVTRAGGKVNQKTELGKRPLGYLLGKHKEGFILLLDLSMETLAVAEFRKALELRDEVLSYMFTIKPTKEMVRPKSVPRAASKPSVSPETKRSVPAKT